MFYLAGSCFCVLGGESPQNPEMVSPAQSGPSREIGKNLSKVFDDEKIATFSKGMEVNK